MQVSKHASEHVALKISEKFESYPPGTYQFWVLSKAALGNFNQPSLPPLTNGILLHTAKEKADLLAALFTLAIVVLRLLKKVPSVWQLVRSW